MSEPCKPTGSRKLRVTLAAMSLITAGFVGILALCGVSEDIKPNDLMPNYTTFVGGVIAALGVFAGSNAAVHIKGKDPQA